MKIQLVSIPVQDPVAAHDIYVSKLNFVSKQFDAEARLAIVVSPEQPEGPEILLEPCSGTFAETYQNAAFAADLPCMIFAVQDVGQEMKRLEAEGVTLRPDLDRPEWGLTNLFEDGCGNLLMLQEASD
jgi:hypothetical protein